MRSLRILGPILVLTVALGCTPTNGDEEPVQTASRNEVAVQVHDRSVAVADYVGVPLQNPDVGPVPCEDPGGNLSGTGVFYMSGTHQLIVGEGRLAETLRSLHRHFTDQGFRVDDIHWFEDGSGELRATDPRGYGHTLLPTTSRAGFAFFVDSPCFQAPEGEDPTDPFWAPPPEVTWTASPGGG